MRSFVDSNILLYSALPHPGEGSKTVAADGILDAGDVALSVQVLQEFYVQATRKHRENRLSEDVALEYLKLWRRFPVQEMTVALFDAAVAASRRWRISYWDAAIVEAARASGCRTLFSEDLSDGQDYDGVRVVNPFR